MSTKEQIEEKLSKCFKSRQPVLLYGDSLDKRNNIILDTHTKNGGKFYDVKYIGNKKKHVFLQDIADEREEKERKWLKNDNISLSRLERCELDIIQKEIHNKVRKHFKSTKKSYKYLDCKGKNGRSVYQLLVNGCLWYEIKIPYSRYGLIPLEQTSSKEFLETYRNPVLIGESYLYDFRGTLFIDNLKCDNRNNEDVLYFHELAIKLTDVFKKNSVNWLVVYVHNRDNFPKRFLNRFDKQIFIEGKKNVGGKKERKHRISNNKFKQLCKDVEREYCTRASGERIFFGKVSEMSKLTKYDKTGRGCKTWGAAKKRYYEVFPSKKANN